MKPRGEVDWQDVLETATGKVSEAVGAVAARGERTATLGRGASGDTTLVADREAENVLVAALTKVRGVRVLTEEAGEVGDRSAPLTAIVDPLDGSSNFERGIQFYCTSVAVTSGKGLEGVFAAAVRDLVKGDVFYAEKGKGAWKNGGPIRTSRVSDPGIAVVGVDVSRTTEGNVRRLAPLLTSVKRQVHFGASALEICLLAEGSLDAYVDVRDRMRIIDFAGAYLIAKEAGATVTSEKGETLAPSADLGSRFSFIAAANRDLHSELLRLLSVRAGT